MDALIGKLTNLAYEIFGIVLPGVVFSVFLCAWWFSLGTCAPFWTRGVVPQLTRSMLSERIAAVPFGRTGAHLLILLVAWYFLGHAVNWASKPRRPERGGWRKRVARITPFLIFHVRRPDESYDPKLQGLFEAIRTEWAHDRKPLSWREFYPIAKTVLSNSGRSSLISTYQNKYTLHRSIAAAAAVMFWLSLLSILAAVISVGFGASARPSWIGLSTIAAGSGVLLTGFSATYAYAWLLWGDTIITESYAIIHGARGRSYDET